jgi:hypothetical protein
MKKYILLIAIGLLCLIPVKPKADFATGLILGSMMADDSSTVDKQNIKIRELQDEVQRLRLEVIMLHRILAEAGIQIVITPTPTPKPQVKPKPIATLDYKKASGGKAKTVKEDRR